MAETRPSPLAKDLLDHLKNRYGTAFVEKATDDLLRSLAASLQNVASMESFGATAAGPASGASSAVLEFDEAPAPKAARKGPTKAALTKAQKALSTLTSGLEGLELNAAMVLRQAAVRTARDDFHHTSGPLTQAVERQLTSVFAARSESLVPPTGAIGATETCWLNRTVRTHPVPEVLAEIAGASEIRSVDVPRRLEPEGTALGGAMGVPAYQSSSGHRGAGVVVAVIDGEAPLTHPALVGRVSQKGNYTREPWGSPNEHGTGVSGIIAADGEVVGVAPGAAIYNYKVFATNRFLHADDFGGSLAVQQALEDGAHIANCSWGAGPAGDGTSREARAFDAAWGLGMVLVKSAGNSGANGPGSLTSPADADGVIVVGATDLAGKKVQFYSSQGPSPNKRAPRPHLVAPGGAASPPATIVDPVISCLPTGGVGSIGVGTSFAAPHISGLLALLVEANPNDSPDQLRNRLLALCTPLKGVSTDIQGEGLPAI